MENSVSDRRRNYFTRVADKLEETRKMICPYNGDTCDCKFGAGTDTSIYSEYTGCPELRILVAQYRRYALV